MRARCLADLDRGVEFYEQLMYPITPKSTRLEGVWWLPSSASRARLVVTNTSGSASVATVTFTGSRGGHHATTVALGPWQLQTLDWPAAFVGETRTDEAGGVSVQYTGNPGAVVAHGLVLDAPARYSAGISLADPGEQVTSRYEGPGVRVALGHDPLRPVILARNVGTAWSHLEGRLRVTGSDGTLQTFAFPSTDLAPGETQLVDAAAAWRRAAEATTGAAIGIEFSYSSAPGSVVLSVTSVSDTLSQVLATPLSDPGTLASATGGYFFELTRTLDSVVFIKNMTDQPQQYHLFISYDTGSWLPGVKTIAPHETQVIDIAQLRDRGTQDAKGHAIPMDATGGQVHWSILGHTDPKGLVGRMEHVDLTHDVDSTYACTYYGDDYYDSSYIDPDSATVAVGDDQYFTAWEQDANAYGDSFDDAYEITDDLDWSSGDPSIADSDFDSDFFGISNGDTYVHASGESLSPCSEFNPRSECYGDYADIELYADFESAQCPGDSQRSQILQEYINYKNAHPTITTNGGFFAGVTAGNGAISPPLPSCADFTQSRSSGQYAFSEINTGDYTVSLVRAPLIAASGSGFGLDAWAAAYGSKRSITAHGGFRNPLNNAAHATTLNGRHMYGDAVDLGNTTAGGDDCTDPANAARYADWEAMVAAGVSAHADFIESSPTDPCLIGCVHVDWRNHSGGYQ